MEQTQQMKDLEFTFLDVYKIYYGSILCKSVEKLEGRSNIDWTDNHMMATQVHAKDVLLMLVDMLICKHMVLLLLNMLALWEQNRASSGPYSRAPSIIITIFTDVVKNNFQWSTTQPASLLRSTV